MLLSLRWWQAARLFSPFHAFAAAFRHFAAFDITAILQPCRQRWYRLWLSPFLRHAADTPVTLTSLFRRQASLSFSPFSLIFISPIFFFAFFSSYIISDASRFLLLQYAASPEFSILRWYFLQIDFLRRGFLRLLRFDFRLHFYFIFSFFFFDEESRDGIYACFTPFLPPAAAAATPPPPIDYFHAIIYIFARFTVTPFSMLPVYFLIFRLTLCFSFLYFHATISRVSMLFQRLSKRHYFTFSLRRQLSAPLSAARRLFAITVSMPPLAFHAADSPDFRRFIFMPGCHYAAIAIFAGAVISLIATFFAAMLSMPLLTLPTFTSIISSRCCWLSLLSSPLAFFLFGRFRRHDIAMPLFMPLLASHAIFIFTLRCRHCRFSPPPLLIFSFESFFADIIEIPTLYWAEGFAIFAISAFAALPPPPLVSDAFHYLFHFRCHAADRDAILRFSSAALRCFSPRDIRYFHFRCWCRFDACRCYMLFADRLIFSLRYGHLFLLFITPFRQFSSALIFSFIITTSLRRH